MKKIILSYLILFFITSSAFCLEDELINYIQNAKKPVIKNENIDDFLITQDFKKTNKNKIIHKAHNEVDFLVNCIDTKIEKPNTNLKYNYENNQKYSFKIQAINNISTRNKTLKEGQFVEFKLLEDFNYKNTLIRKDAIIKGKIENISQNGTYGIPYNLTISNFKYNNIALDGTLRIQGANRAIWVYPCAYLTSMFFGMGLLFIPIKGGHAKLSKRTKRTISFFD